MTDQDAYRTYVAIARRHWRRLVLVPFAFGMLATAIVLVLPRKYVAEAQFTPQEPEAPRPTSAGAAGLSNIAGIAAQFGVTQLGGLVGTQGAGSPGFYTDLLYSRQLTHDVVTARYSITEPRRFTGTLVDYYHPWLQRTPRAREIAVTRRLRERIFVAGFDRSTGIVTLRVTTGSRQLSEQIARRYLDLVNDFNLRRLQTHASIERDFAAKRAAESLDSLHAAEAALARFHLRNRGFNATSDLTVEEANLQRRVALAQQIYTRLAQEYETARIQAVRNTPVITVIDAPEGLVEPEPRHIPAIAALVMGVVFLVVLAWSVARERAAPAVRAGPGAPGMDLPERAERS